MFCESESSQNIDITNTVWEIPITLHIFYGGGVTLLILTHDKDPWYINMISSDNMSLLQYVNPIRIFYT